MLLREVEIGAGMNRSANGLDTALLPNMPFYGAIQVLCNAMSWGCSVFGYFSDTKMYGPTSLALRGGGSNFNKKNIT